MTRTNEHGQAIGDPVDTVPRPTVGPVTLVGNRVRIEPWDRAAHLDALYDAAVQRSPASSWTYLSVEQPGDPAALSAWLDGMAADPGAVPLTICRPGGRAVGTASYLRLDAANGSVEVGAICYAAELQRTAAATEAMALMMRHVFDDLGYRRYEWKCDVLNAPSRAAAERLGFRYEGTFRNALVSKGRNRDTAWFSIIDREWPPVRSELERWLDPGNFDGSGGQRTRLRVPPLSGTCIPNPGTGGRLS